MDLEAKSRQTDAHIDKLTGRSVEAVGAPVLAKPRIPHLPQCRWIQKDKPG